VSGAGLSHRYVFVAGLHRTGTSFIARWLGEHPDIADIRGAPVPENEGCYLQGAIPHTARDGIPGEYATDPAQHLTETNALNTLDTKLRLEHEWGAWFDADKPWRVEKSPVNLTRMRLLQGLFPLSQFIIITRHPLFMAQALSKWSGKSLSELTRYGCEAYQLALSDMAYLHCAMVMRYEDFVVRPKRSMQAMEAFLGLEHHVRPSGIHDGNLDYQARADTGGECEALGYGEAGAVHPLSPIVNHPLRDVRETAKTLLATKMRQGRR
jgi:hypothetical protein